MKYLSNKKGFLGTDNISNKTIPYYDRNILKDNTQEHINLKIDNIDVVKKSKTLTEIC